MSDLRRTIDIYFNVEKGWRCVSADNTEKDSQNLELWRGTQVLYRAHLLMDDGTYFKPPANVTFYYGIDNVYTSGHADLVTALNAVFNVSGDWADASVIAGKICWRVDLRSTTLAAAFTDDGDPADANMYEGLWMTPAGGEPTLICHWDVKMNNIAVNPGTPSDAEEVTYVTTDLLYSMLSYITSESGAHGAVIKNIDGVDVLGPAYPPGES